MRACSKTGCRRPAVATLTYNYADSTVIIGPASTSAEPHALDLCDEHASRLTVPRGWDVVRLQTKFEPAPPSKDDLLALVDVVREVAGRPEPDAQEEHGSNWFGDTGSSQSGGENERPSRIQLDVVTGDVKSPTAQPPDSRLGPLQG